MLNKQTFWWLFKLTFDWFQLILTYCLFKGQHNFYFIYVADPATFLASNPVLGP